MKKVSQKFKDIVIQLVFASLLILAACSTVPVNNEHETPVAESMFVEVERTGRWRVVYHRDTKVMYTVSSGAYNMGSFTLMVDPDGDPMIYEASGVCP